MQLKIPPIPPLVGPHLIELKEHRDSRGSFTRLFCRQTCEKMDFQSSAVVQSGLSFNHKRGTLRGMHYQLAPKAQEKWVYCLKGEIYDLILDLRQDSPTFGSFSAINLSAENPRILFIPKGFAHGFMTLEDNTEVLYQFSEFQFPEWERTIRWDDPFFHMEWPMQPSAISEKDAMQSDFSFSTHLSNDRCRDQSHDQCPK